MKECNKIWCVLLLLYVRHDLTIHKWIIQNYNILQTRRQPSKTLQKLQKVNCSLCVGINPKHSYHAFSFFSKICFRLKGYDLDVLSQLMSWWRQTSGEKWQILFSFFDLTSFAVNSQWQMARWDVYISEFLCIILPTLVIFIL